MCLLPCAAQGRHRQAHGQRAFRVEGSIWTRKANQTALTVHLCQRGGLTLVASNTMMWKRLSPPAHPDIWTVKTLARAICANAAVPTRAELSGLLFHSLFATYRVSNWRFQHKLKQETSRPYQICSSGLILAPPALTIHSILIPSGLKEMDLSCLIDP